MAKEHSKYMALAPNTIKREVFRIQYETTDESFDHAFGSETKTSLEWTKAEAFVPVLDEWIDVTNNSEFQSLANQLLNEVVLNE